jgi:hypothetical protein
MSCSSLQSVGTPSVPLLISTDGEVQNRHPCQLSFPSDVHSDLQDQCQLHLLYLKPPGGPGRDVAGVAVTWLIDKSALMRLAGRQ